jgi:hypothetical protein
MFMLWDAYVVQHNAIKHYCPRKEPYSVFVAATKLNLLLLPRRCNLVVSSSFEDTAVL